MFSCSMHMENKEGQRHSEVDECKSQGGLYPLGSLLPPVPHRLNFVLCKVNYPATLSEIHQRTFHGHSGMQTLQEEVTDMGVRLIAKEGSR